MARANARTVGEALADLEGEATRLIHELTDPAETLDRTELAGGYE